MAKSSTSTPKNGQPSQNWEWYPDAAEDGWGQLRNGDSHLCMERNDTNSNIDQWRCVTGADNELWKPVYDPAGGGALQLKSNQMYLTTNGTIDGISKAELTPTLNRASIWGAHKVS